MIKLLPSISLMLLLIVAGACHDISNSNLSELSAELGERFPIKYGQQVVIKDENLVIRLDSVMDSRCPVGTECFLAGNARIVLMAIHDSDHTFIPLNTTLKPKEANWLDYHFKLLSLTPRPKATGEVKLKGYVAVLVITKQ